MSSISDTSSTFCPTVPSPAPRLWHLVVAIGGLIAATIGMIVLVMHSQTPGIHGRTPSQWPETSQIRRSVDQPTLVVFLHPRCPCGSATLRELERLLARQQAMQTVVVMLRPENSPEGWERGDYWDWTRSLAGVTVEVDKDGVEARRFGISTSGHVCMFASDGRLLFSGGITAARGHEGDNLGRTSIEQMLVGNEAACTSPVYGCPLFSASDRLTSE